MKIHRNLDQLMMLKFENGEAIADPTEEVIDDSFRMLNNSNREFIVADDKDNSLKVVRRMGRGFYLERYLHSEKPYRSAKSVLSQKAVKSVLMPFLRAEDGWKDTIRWTQIERQSKVSESFKLLSLVSTTLFFSLYIAYWYEWPILYDFLNPAKIDVNQFIVVCLGIWFMASVPVSILELFDERSEKYQRTRAAFIFFIGIISLFYCVSLAIRAIFK